ncbi:putative zinc metalloprotease [Flagelloscypha sp. PMI_526]|nr:putative zinc metalloprotease [Flagelloscypha sp. PMI_526]
MTFREKVSTVLGYRTIPVSIVAFLSYLAIFVAIQVTDEAPPIPKDWLGLNLTEAYTDLSQITQNPHPYNSHANAFVHDYILNRLQALSANHSSFVTVLADDISNGTWSNPSVSIYFEGTNVLAKIEGTDLTDDAVLFSAHYDSVSTAPGATDDGMGVVTLIQLFEYFVANQPKRTAVFNINNGEEDWLNGARAFLQHPWSNLTTIFINLEGAASGGRPLLFRGTSIVPVRSFTSVLYPHANVVSSDAFSRGVIRSGTDYSEYFAAGMQGIDIAFYKGRSRYHTKYDGVAYTEGQERALWAMMEVALESGKAMLESGPTTKEAATTPVYFDLFGRVAFVFPLRSLVVFNIVALVLGPILLILFHALATRRVPSIKLSWRIWFKNLWKWTSFWLALAVAIVLNSFLINAYVWMNPWILYSSSLLVLGSLFALSYLSIVFVLNIPLGITITKQSLLVQLYFLTWVFLVGSTVVANKLQVASGYFFTVWNLTLWLALAIGCLEAAVFKTEPTEKVGDDNEEQTGSIQETREEADEESTERTPLLQPLVSRHAVIEDAEKDTIGFWFLQFVLSLPPVILIAHLAVIVVNGMTQTVVDGSDALFVYGALSAVGIALLLPLVPFLPILHIRLNLLVGILLIASVLYLLFGAQPFDILTPFKVYFQQTVTFPVVELGQTAIAVPTVETILTGLVGPISAGIIPRLTSAKGKTIRCLDSTVKHGLTSCSWESSSLIPQVASATSHRMTAPNDNATLLLDAPHFFAATVKRASTNSSILTFSITPTNSLNCRLYFNETQKPVSHFILGADEVAGYPPSGEAGVAEIRLWSRTWGNTFDVDVHMHSEAASDLVEGVIACEWAEYESGMLGIEDTPNAKIPAYEEALREIPDWAVPSKFSDGLVEVKRGFRI